jgi:hypothetical protein
MKSPDDLSDRELWERARPEGLPPEAIRRVRARLMSAVRTPARVRRVPGWAMTALLLLVGGVAGASVTTLVIGARTTPARVATQVATSSPGKVRGRSARRDPAPPLPAVEPAVGEPAVDAPAVAPAAETIAPVPAAPRRIATKAPTSSPTSSRSPTPSLSPSPSSPPPHPPSPPAPSLSPPPAPPPPPVEAIAVEANLLGAALRALRQNNSPARALALLDRYAAQFPAGALGAEATLARVDSLRRLGQDQPLRELLEERPITKMPRARELQVLRGELRLRAGQPREAASDFDAILAGSAEDDLGARALYGRASCRSRLGDVEGARADLRLYLSRFPRGERAAALRASDLESER